MTTTENSQNELPLPPGPSHVVTSEEIRDDPLEFLESIARDHGAISMHITDKGERVVMVSSPELAGEVLLAPESRFTKQGTPDDDMLTPLLGEGLLTSHGEEWRRQRDLTTPMFQRQRVEAFGPQIVASTTRLTERWLEHSTDTPIQIDRDLTSLALEIVALAIVGGDLSGIGYGFGEAVDAVNAAVSHGDPRDTPDTPEVLGHFAAFTGAKRTIDRIVKLLIDARRMMGPPDEGPVDLLTVLLDAIDPRTGEPLTDEELRAQVMTMVMAGHETTAKALTWSLYLMSQHPDVAAQVHAEIQNVLGDRDATIADIPALTISRSVIQEAMRMYPPIWVISRRVVADDVLGGHRIPAGSLVCVSPWVLHHSDDIWDEPFEFKPQRFRDGDGPSPFSYVPFGGGPRVCIGRGFALIEAQLAFATICQRLDLDLWPGHHVAPEALVTLKPVNGMHMSARSRG
jgi:cytochrome P450